jgi:hypothetical protein
MQHPFWMTAILMFSKNLHYMIKLNQIIDYVGSLMLVSIVTVEFFSSNFGVALQKLVVAWKHIHVSSDRL